jgi:hypothetical protein
VILSPDLILATHQPFNCTSHHPQPPATAHGGANTGSSTPGLADRSSAPTGDAPLPPPISTKALVIPRPRPRLLLPPVLSLSLLFLSTANPPWPNAMDTAASGFELAIRIPYVNKNITEVKWLTGYGVQRRRPSSSDDPPPAQNPTKAPRRQAKARGTAAPKVYIGPLRGAVEPAALAVASTRLSTARSPGQRLLHITRPGIRSLLCGEDRADTWAPVISDSSAREHG